LENKTTTAALVDVGLPDINGVDLLLLMGGNSFKKVKIVITGFLTPRTPAKLRKDLLMLSTKTCDARHPPQGS
jgi:hypothetical protein